MSKKLRENYRIPTIDEFVDEFEFEVYSEGYFEDSVEDFCGWYKYKFGYNNWRDLDEIQIELDLGNIQCYIIKREKMSKEDERFGLWEEKLINGLDLPKKYKEQLKQKKWVKNLQKKK